MSTKRTGFTKKVRDLVEERAGWWCERCGFVEWQQIHHRRPRGMGGSHRDDDNPSAALAVCVTCHADIETHRAEAREWGFLVPQHRNPAEVPVLRRGSWVLLDTRGDYLEIPEPAGGKAA